MGTTSIKSQLKLAMHPLPCSNPSELSLSMHRQNNKQGGHILLAKGKVNAK